MGKIYAMIVGDQVICMVSPMKGIIGTVLSIQDDSNANTHQATMKIHVTVCPIGRRTNQDIYVFQRCFERLTP